MEKVDYIVVGQGIAGSLLAWELWERGYKVCMIDDGCRSRASSVAAGLMNPVTGMRLVKSWKVDKFLPLARGYYRELEERLGVSFFKEREIVRFFRNEIEVRQWEKRREDVGYEEYIGERFEAGAWGRIFEDSYGSFIIKGGGSLDTKIFLDAMRKSFEDGGVLNEDGFDYGEVRLEEEGVGYKGIRAKKIIFCEGYKVVENPWFRDLKWVPAKGEILTIKIEEILPDKVMNNGKWLMPIGEGSYRVGASYHWENLDSLCTEEGREEVLMGLRGMLCGGNIEVVGHEAGVRPCTKDTRPYVGLHKEYKSLGILNGLGSKGTMMAPYYAREMGEFLVTGKALDSEVRVERG